jgi:hypothetical protein
MVAFSLGVIIVAGLPYLSSLYQDSAFALARTDAENAAERAEVARWFQPTDPGPYETQATIYHNAAVAALETQAGDRAGAVLDDLALSIHSLEEAANVEPVNWVLHYRAGVATMNLLLVTGYATGHDPDIDYAEIAPRIHGLDDWSGLGGSTGTLPAPGAAAGSLATDETERAAAVRFRDMSLGDLLALAESHLSAARVRNPLSADVEAAGILLDSLKRDLSQTLSTDNALRRKHASDLRTYRQPWDGGQSLCAMPVGIVIA